MSEHERLPSKPARLDPIRQVKECMEAIRTLRKHLSLDENPEFVIALYAAVEKLTGEAGERRPPVEDEPSREIRSTRRPVGP